MHLLVATPITQSTLYYDGYDRAFNFSFAGVGPYGTQFLPIVDPAKGCAGYGVAVMSAEIQNPEQTQVQSLLLCCFFGWAGRGELSSCFTEFQLKQRKHVDFLYIHYILICKRIYKLIILRSWK